jgi:hypothetical protein
VVVAVSSLLAQPIRAAHSAEKIANLTKDESGFIFSASFMSRRSVGAKARPH